MKSLRDVIADALNGAYDPAAGDWHSRHDEHASGYYALCHVCRGDVAKLADTVRDALMANEWMRLVLIEKYREIANQYPEDMIKAEGNIGERIAMAAVRERMLAEIARLKEAASHAA